jgi:hypothetical protein
MGSLANSSYLHSVRLGALRRHARGTVKRLANVGIRLVAILLLVVGTVVPLLNLRACEDQVQGD